MPDTSEQEQAQATRVLRVSEPWQEAVTLPWDEKTRQCWSINPGEQRRLEQGEILKRYDPDMDLGATVLWLEDSTQ